MARTKIELYYDIVSPWSYLAFVVLKRYESIWNLDLHLKPIYLGGVMAGSGNRPPISVSNKGDYMWGHDLPRTASYYKVNINSKQEGFPPNTIQVMRLLRVIEDVKPEILSAVSKRFWELGFENQLVNVVNPESFENVLSGVVDDKDFIKDLIQKSTTQKYKDLLKIDTESLVTKGSFGAPWIFITHPTTAKIGTYFGSDRFEIIANWLGVRWLGPSPHSVPKL